MRFRRGDCWCISEELSIISENGWYIFENIDSFGEWLMYFGEILIVSGNSWCISRNYRFGLESGNWIIKTHRMGVIYWMKRIAPIFACQKWIHEWDMGVSRRNLDATPMWWVLGRKCGWKTHIRNLVTTYKNLWKWCRNWMELWWFMGELQVMCNPPIIHKI